MNRLNPTRLLIFLSVLLPLCMLVAVATGAVSIAFSDVINTFLNTRINTGSSIDSSQHYYSIIIDIRFPRVLLAAIIGAVLAISGAAMQGLFRNPLADPSLVGVTAGASLGGSLVIALSASYATQWIGLPLISLGAFLGGILAVWVVYRLANGPYGMSVATMLLAGIGITALAGSITSLLEFSADNEMLRRISLWRMGGIDGASYERVGVATIIILLMCTTLPRCSQALNALLLGESEAKHLGIDVERLKKIIIVLVTLGVGVSVALAGTIAFIGLVVPHILRLLIGPDHRFLLPASALGGAVLLVLADNFSRILLAPAELPVGIVTALVGVPFFVSLLKRRYIYGFN